VSKVKRLLLKAPCMEKTIPERFSIVFFKGKIKAVNGL
jgi:hypothetical protein